LCLIVVVMLFFQILLTVHKSIVRPPCSGLVLVLQSEERPNRELMLYAGVVQQRLLLKLLQLLCIEAEGVRPEVGARVDEGRAQGLSSEWVHKWRLCQTCPRPSDWSLRNLTRRSANPSRWSPHQLCHSLHSCTLSPDKR
jgi:hypothetical protein